MLAVGSWRVGAKVWILCLVADKVCRAGPPPLTPHRSCASGLYLLHHWMLNQPHKYWQALRALVAQAQQYDDDRLLRNPYLQISTMIFAEETGATSGH